MGEAKRRKILGVEKSRAIPKTDDPTKIDRIDPLRRCFLLLEHPNYPGIERSHDGTFYERLPNGSMRKISQEAIIRRFHPPKVEMVRMERGMKDANS